jgi:hypothetical protein
VSHVDQIRDSGIVHKGFTATAIFARIGTHTYTCLDPSGCDTSALLWSPTGDQLALLNADAGVLIIWNTQGDGRVSSSSLVPHWTLCPVRNKGWWNDFASVAQMHLFLRPLRLAPLEPHRSLDRVAAAVGHSTSCFTFEGKLVGSRRRRIGLLGQVCARRRIPCAHRWETECAYHSRRCSRRTGVYHIPSCTRPQSHFDLPTTVRQFVAGLTLQLGETPIHPELVTETAIHLYL